LTPPRRAVPKKATALKRRMKEQYIGNAVRRRGRGDRVDTAESGFKAQPQRCGAGKARFEIKGVNRGAGEGKSGNQRRIFRRRKGFGRIANSYFTGKYPKRTRYI